MAAQGEIGRAGFILWPFVRPLQPQDAAGRKMCPFPCGLLFPPNYQHRPARLPRGVRQDRLAAGGQLGQLPLQRRKIGRSPAPVLLAYYSSLGLLVADSQTVNRPETAPGFDQPMVGITAFRTCRPSKNGITLPAGKCVCPLARATKEETVAAAACKKRQGPSSSSIGWGKPTACFGRASSITILSSRRKRSRDKILQPIRLLHHLGRHSFAHARLAVARRPESYTIFRVSGASAPCRNGPAYVGLSWLTFLACQVWATYDIVGLAYGSPFCR